MKKWAILAIIVVAATVWIALSPMDMLRRHRFLATTGCSLDNTQIGIGRCLASRYDGTSHYPELRAALVRAGFRPPSAPHSEAFIYVGPYSYGISLFVEHNGDRVRGIHAS